ncbi:MAG: DUF1295 domain-containing protein [Chloroflexota bacterium]
MKLKHFIDTNKGVTFLVILGLIAAYQQWDNPAAWVYLGLHGTYGVLWVLKSRVFPDASWERKVPAWFGVVAWAALMLYWIPAYLLTSSGVQSPAWVLGLAVSLNSLGIFFHFAADMQKHTALKLQPGRLITDGMMALSRNSNYFGELLIYLSFAVLAMTWVAFLPLAAFVVFYWVPNMVRKDRALAELPGFEEYKQKTKAFFPYLF